MPELTKRLVDQLTPQAHEYFAWDAGLPGFGVRIFPSGRKTYLVQYRDPQGRTRRYTFGPHGVLTVQQARARAQQALARVRDGDNAAQERQERRQAPTLAQVAERFAREHVPTLKPTTASEYRGMLRRHLLPALGTRAITTITRDDVAALHLALRDTPYTANRVRSVLSIIFTCAETWGLVPEGMNPTLRVKAYREFKRERALTRAELGRLGAVLREAELTHSARPEVVALIRLLILTGARLRELLHLRWEWIDWDRGRIRLPDSKGLSKIKLAIPCYTPVFLYWRDADGTDRLAQDLADRDRQVAQRQCAALVYGAHRQRTGAGRATARRASGLICAWRAWSSWSQTALSTRSTTWHSCGNTASRSLNLRRPWARQ